MKLNLTHLSFPGCDMVVRTALGMSRHASSLSLLLQNGVGGCNASAILQNMTIMETCLRGIKIRCSPLPLSLSSIILKHKHIQRHPTALSLYTSHSPIMQEFTLFLLTLASLLLPIAAGPLNATNATNNVRTLARPIFSANLLIGTYLYRRQFPSRQKRLHADTLCPHTRSRVRPVACLPEHNNGQIPGRLWPCMLLHQIGT